MEKLISTVSLSPKNFGLLLTELEKNKFKNIHPLELFFYNKKGKVYVTDEFFDIKFSFNDCE